MYRIEYVSFRQGPYRICVISAADRIVLARYGSAAAVVSSDDIGQYRSFFGMLGEICPLLTKSCFEFLKSLPI